VRSLVGCRKHTAWTGLLSSLTVVATDMGRVWPDRSAVLPRLDEESVTVCYNIGPVILRLTMKQQGLFACP